MKVLKVTPIKNGTVIDHITSGMALKVLKILGIEREKRTSIVSVAMHVSSKKMGRKDIVKVEDRELSKEEVDKIALISPKATISIIRDYKVVEKRKVNLPDSLTGILKCENINCISNSGREKIRSKFNVIDKEKISLKCWYCGKVATDIPGNII
ncbi:MAG: aspartate carbamoyltransferase regulatory subunit [Candidatus Thermoplasmatota archaeon]